MCVVAFRFLPSTCPEQCPVLLDEDGTIREGGFKKDLSRRLDFSMWLLAWDRYAIGVQDCIIVAFRRSGTALFALQELPSSSSLASRVQ